MKNLLAIIVTIYIQSTNVFCQTEQNNFTDLKDPYLGQKPPGEIPIIFAPGIISTDLDLHSCPSFSLNGKSVFWRIMNSGEKNGVYYMEIENNTWTRPKIAPFIETEKDLNNDVPLFVNNDTLFFTSDREFEKTRKKRLWFITKKNGKWEKPVCFQNFAPENISVHWQFSFTSNGNIYFTGMKDDGFGKYDLFVAKKHGNKYTYVILPEPINTADSDISPYIAPDESYMIYSSLDRKDGYGKGDLYICFNDRDKHWTNPLNLGPQINSKENEWCPLVTQDGKYLFFISSKNGSFNCYWVDTVFIEELKPNEIK